VKVSKDLSKDYYEKIFSFKDLEKENSRWQQISDPEQFENLVLSNLKSETVESYMKEKKLILVFVIKYDKTSNLSWKRKKMTSINYLMNMRIIS